MKRLLALVGAFLVASACGSHTVARELPKSAAAAMTIHGCSVLDARIVGREGRVRSSGHEVRSAHSHRTYRWKPLSRLVYRFEGRVQSANWTKELAYFQMTPLVVAEWNMRTYMLFQSYDGTRRGPNLVWLEIGAEEIVEASRDIEFWDGPCGAIQLIDPAQNRVLQLWKFVELLDIGEPQAALRQLESISVTQPRLLYQPKHDVPKQWSIDNEFRLGVLRLVHTCAIRAGDVVSAFEKLRDWAREGQEPSPFMMQLMAADLRRSADEAEACCADKTEGDCRQ